MIPCRLFVLTAALFTLASAHAEVIELEGKVKSIDKDARSISVVRKTPKGEKVLDLEVAKKAGDLSEVKEGDTVAFSYDPDLELITKIAEEGGGDTPSPEKATEKMVRVRYHFATDGTSKLEAIKLSSRAKPVLGGYAKEEKGKGVWEITQTFEDPDALKRFSGPFSEDDENVSYSAKAKALAFNPKNGSKAVLSYPLRFRLPLTVEADIRTASEHGHFQINPNANTNKNLHPFVNVFTHDGCDTLDLSCSWVVSRDASKGEPTIKEIFGKRGISISKTASMDGFSPVEVDPEGIYILKLGTFNAGPGDCTWYLNRLSMTARFAPTLGLSLKQDGEAILAEKVLRESLAEMAGIKAGDIVVSIDQKNPGTLQRAMLLLSLTNYGDSWEIEVERGGERKTFSIKAE